MTQVKSLIKHKNNVLVKLSFIFDNELRSILNGRNYGNKVLLQKLIAKLVDF